MPDSVYTVTDSAKTEVRLKRAAPKAPPGDKTLDGYLGKNISVICNNKYDSNKDSHCAHFVSHVKKYSFSGALLCSKMKYETRNNPGVCLRVNEVFAKCPKVGKWEDKPEKPDACLAFITLSTNVDLKKGTMSSHPRKHVGIYSGGMIYHYSNSKNKVVKQTPEKFAKHYKGGNVEVYYGTFPTR